MKFIKSRGSQKTRFSPIFKHFDTTSKNRHFHLIFNSSKFIQNIQIQINRKNHRKIQKKSFIQRKNQRKKKKIIQKKKKFKKKFKNKKNFNTKIQQLHTGGFYENSYIHRKFIHSYRNLHNSYRNTHKYTQIHTYSYRIHTNTHIYTHIHTPPITHTPPIVHPRIHTLINSSFGTRNCTSIWDVEIHTPQFGTRKYVQIHTIHTIHTGNTHKTTQYDTN